jgi:hypothetical protein
MIPKGLETFRGGGGDKIIGKGKKEKTEILLIVTFEFLTVMLRIQVF